MSPSGPIIPRKSRPRQLPPKSPRPRGCGISHTILKVDRVGDYEGEMHAPRFLPQGEMPRHTIAPKLISRSVRVCSIIPIQCIWIRKGGYANGNLETRSQFLPIGTHGDACTTGKACLRGDLEPE